MGILGNLNMFHELEKHMIAIQQLSSGTVITRRSRIKIFFTWLNGRTITPHLAEEFFFWLRTEKKLSNTSLNTYYIALHSLQKFLVSRGQEPFMMNLSRYVEEEPDIIPLSTDEIRLIRNECLKTTTNPLKQSMQDITILHTDIGCRWEDAQIFQCKSVDLVGSEVIYREKKTGRVRNLPITEPLLGILKRRTAGKKPDDLVFENTVGNTLYYSDYHKFLQGIAGLYGIVKRVSPHNIRRSFGQNSYNKTRDILLTQKLFNHKRIETTLRYVKSSKEHLKEAQETHPHLDLPAYAVIEHVEKLLETMKLDDNKKFDKLKIRLAKTKFLADLYDSIDRKSVV